MRTYVLLSVVTFLAGFTQGLSGFGSVLLALPLLTLFIDVKSVIPLVALYGVAMTILLLVQLRSHLEWKKIYPLLIGSLPGIPIGVYLLKKMDPAMIQAVLGAVLLSYALFGLFYRPVVKSMKQHWVYITGFLAGCLGGALGASGPPVIVYTSLQPWRKDTIKVTLQGYFVVSGLLVVFFQTLGGLTTAAVWHLFFISIPALILGTYAGSFFYGKISEDRYRIIMLILLGCLGVFMMLRSL